MYLRFLGPAETRHGTLYFQRGILMYGQLCFGNCCHAHTPDVPQLEGALDVLSVKNSFEGGDIGLEFGNHFHDSAINGMQPIGKWYGWANANHSATDINTIGAIALDDAVSGNSGPAVDSEYSHWDQEVALANSSSSMSKFA